MTGTDAAAAAPSSARPGALIGYARCSAVAQDTEIQRAALAGYGVPAGRVYVDEGFTGTGTSRPGLDQAVAAVHAGDTLIVPRLTSAQELEDAEDTAALQEWRAREAAGQTSCVPADQVWQRLGLTR